MKNLIFVVATFLFHYSFFAQTLIMNEVSNGPSGNQEYVEFVVIDTAITFNCNATTPPCINIQGWIFDDNSGYHGASGIAAGAVRFSFDPMWACVPLGTIIVIYNDADPNTQMPANDLSLSDGNCKIIAPIGNTQLFERNATTPGAVACSYPAVGWIAGGAWSNTLLANPGDCARIVNLAGCEVFSVCWGAANLNALIYFNSGGSGSQNVWSFNNGDPETQANWTEGSAAAGGNQTPGAPNNAANAAYINQFNNGCLPIPPITVTATSVNAGCTCTGTATATASGSIPGYTYAWYNATFTPIGQTAATATGLCAGTYHVIATSSIGCSDTATVTISSTATTTVSVNNPTICAGASTTLTATPSITGGTFSWSPGGQTTQTISVNPSTTTTYTVTYTLAGCTSTGSGIVTVNPLPIVSVNDISLCATATGTLTATGATTYSWSPASFLSSTTGSSVTFTPGSTTTYTITGTGSNGCVNTDIATVSVLPNAPINAGPDVAICSGGTTTLNATSGVTYNWNNGLGIGNGFSVSPAATTTYTVVGTDAVGCVGTDAVTVTVNPLPVVNAGIDQTICGGTSVTLSGSGASTYSWSGGITNGVSFVPSATATYTLTGTTAAGCTATDIVTINVNPLPTVIAGNDQTICAGTAVTLNGSGATTYSWSGGITNGIAFVPSSTTTYTLTGTSAAGCTATDQVTITVNPLPIVNAGTDQTICAETSVTLSATGASTYSWNNGVTNGVSFIPTNTTTYTVTGTSAQGCIATDQVLVTVNPLPNPIINGPTSYCTGFTSALGTSSSFTSYAWSTGATTPSINATIANNPITVNVTNLFGCSATSATYILSENNVILSNSSVTICQGQSANIHGNTQTVSGVYSQTFTSPTGCDSTSNVTLTVNPLPLINAGVDQQVCTPSTITLNGSGGTTYSWNNGVTNAVSFTQAIGTTVYTLTGTDANGCSNTDQVSVTVNPLPTVNAGPDQAICAGNSTTLTGAGALTYSWNNAITNALSFTPILTNTYTVTGTDANGCTNTDQVNITVNPLPTVNAGNDQIICEGTSIGLTANGALNYTWSNGVSNGSTFTPTATATYTVTGTDVNGCENTDQIIITVDPLPLVVAGNDQTICEGTSITLAGAGASSYSWNNGVLNNIAFTPAVGNQTYTVTGTSANGCSATDQVTITVNPLPTINAGPDQAICLGAQVVLSGTGATTLAWTGGITNNLPFNPTVTTTYTLTGTSVDGCVNQDNVTVTVNSLPTVFAGTDLVICEGSTVVLSASGATSYSWDHGIVNGQTFTPPTGSSTYTVTGTNSAGCVNTDQVLVNVEPAPIVSFVPDQTTGCTPLTVNFTNTTANTSDCIWTINNGTTIVGCDNVSVTFTQGGCYDVTLNTTSQNGCSGSATVIDLICVEEAPTASFTQSTSIISEFNPSVSFQNNSIGANQYTWDFGDHSTTSQLVNPAHDYSTTELGSFTIALVASSTFGCVDTAYSTVTIEEELIYYVPNTFTPDNDNYNQIFKPVFTSGFDPFDYTLLIFNRWGEIIFESHNTEVGWDGSYGQNNEIGMVQDGTFTWKIEFKTSKNDKRIMEIGHVNVLK